MNVQKHTISKFVPEMPLTKCRKQDFLIPDDKKNDENIRQINIDLHIK